MTSFRADLKIVVADKDMQAKLSRSVGFNRCTDPTFTELKSALQQWFPVEAAS